MKAYHNSRELSYRAPYGAVAAGEPVMLAIDVEGASGATVQLRTWTQDAGEALLEMSESADVAGRYTAVLTPQEPGITWYHFVIEGQGGDIMRYGAREGRTGGEGHLLGWEPPSFQLTAYSPGEAAGGAGAGGAGESGPFNAALPGFADAVVRFMRRELTAGDLAEVVDTVRESYPAAWRPRALELLEGPGCAPLFARLAGRNDPAAGIDVDRDLDEGARGLAKGRLWCASLVRALMPEPPVGEPAAGAGEDGAYDGAVRRWDLVTADCADIVGNAADVRRALDLFEHGAYSCFASGDDVFGFWLRAANGEGGREAACVLVNASLERACDVLVPMEGEAVSEVIGGYGVEIVPADAARADAGALLAPGDADRFARVHLTQLGSAIAYFHPRERLARPMEPGLGVLAHITSLPTGKAKETRLYCHPERSGPEGRVAEGSPAPRPGEILRLRPSASAQDDKNGIKTRLPKQPGTLGAPARAFVDWLAEAGVRYWQVLPVNPTDGFGSPYAGISAFAGNTRLLDGGAEGDVEGGNLPEPADAEAYRDFRERERSWLEPYACFMAIRQKVGEPNRKKTAKGAPGMADVPWQDWPKKYRRFDPELVEGDPKLRAYAENWRRAQFAFEQQWRELRTYANGRGVRIIGDMPIYVSADSSDVWAHPELFQLGEDGRPAMVAGCPPDQFAAEGQVWGNPVYDWDAVRESGYDWWLRRLARAFELYDVVRLDHFIGFARYYSIPAGEKAAEGRYYAGPGIDLFRRAREKLGPLPIIAEDLGLITPAVRALGAACGFPGMDIVQFVDGNDPLSGYRPRPEKVAYTGTHDNQTLVGYCASRYPGIDALEAAGKLAESVVSCDADVCIVALQDLLGLGDEARMNTPGTAEGNWAWQAAERDIDAARDRARELAELKEGRDALRVPR